MLCFSMRMLAVPIACLIAAVVLLPYSPAHACNVCHSKNPKMARMHEKLGYKDCFACHGADLKKRVISRKPG